MMKIKFTKKFKKHLEKLPEKLKHKTILTIRKFVTNPHHPGLYNHALCGSLEGVRSISVTGDIRILFEEYDGYVLVIMLDIGTHAQLYE